jgi:hypothetical protein
MNSTTTAFLTCDKKTSYRRRLDRSETHKDEARPASTQEIVSTQDIVEAREAWFGKSS